MTMSTANVEADEPNMLSLVFSVLLGLFALALIVPAITLTIRRLHDIGMRGWWSLLMIVPGAGFIAFIIFGVIPTQPLTNKFGPVPD